ncbi:unnamed protein product [Adineta ricciae]|uniref:Uncharacterized protein n=1 Tax=Adineta ricciae TaxID=249248 RepID=A0A815GUV5_ADIRI|nr:unnamed protein product [Adineta ricciae]CAF1637138.1 unnamed protein product [Adineta ricciae]
MTDGFWTWDYFAQCTSRLKEVEKLLTNEQIQYLNEYYTMNRMPSVNEVLLICNQWNLKGIGWLVDIEDWFFGRRMAETEIQERRRLTRILPA